MIEQRNRPTQDPLEGSKRSATGGMESAIEPDIISRTVENTIFGLTT